MRVPVTRSEKKVQADMRAWSSAWPSVAALVSGVALMACHAHAATETEPAVSPLEQAGVTRRPRFVSGRAPVITDEARQAGVSGQMSIRCTLTAEGHLIDCTVLVGLPFMNDEVVDALQTWLYTPVIFKGKAIAVSFVLHLRFPKLPAERPK